MDGTESTQVIFEANQLSPRARVLSVFDLQSLGKDDEYSELMETVGGMIISEKTSGIESSSFERFTSISSAA